MELHPASWHYRLANTYGRGEFGRRTDLCAYVQRFMLGCFFALCAVLLGVFAGFIFVLAPGLWIASCLIEWHLFAPDEIAIIGLTLWGAIAGLVGFALWADYRDRSNKPFLPVPAPVRAAYRGWKEKYCPLIEFSGN